jgi:hypothetical protein
LLGKRTLALLGQRTVALLGQRTVALHGQRTVALHGQRTVAKYSPGRLGMPRDLGGWWLPCGASHPEPAKLKQPPRRKIPAGPPTPNQH